LTQSASICSRASTRAISSTVSNISRCSAMNPAPYARGGPEKKPVAQPPLRPEAP
jgi:hypothetical protein